MPGHAPLVACSRILEGCCSGIIIGVPVGLDHLSLHHIGAEGRRIQALILPEAELVAVFFQRLDPPVTNLTAADDYQPCKIFRRLLRSPASSLSAVL